MNAVIASTVNVGAGRQTFVSTTVPNQSTDLVRDYFAEDIPLVASPVLSQVSARGEERTATIPSPSQVYSPIRERKFWLSRLVMG